MSGLPDGTGLQVCSREDQQPHRCDLLAVIVLAKSGKESSFWHSFVVRACRSPPTAEPAREKASRRDRDACGAVGTLV